MRRKRTQTSLTLAGHVCQVPSTSHVFFTRASPQLPSIFPSNNSPPMIRIHFWSRGDYWAHQRSQCQGMQCQTPPRGQRCFECGSSWVRTQPRIPVILTAHFVTFLCPFRIIQSQQATVASFQSLPSPLFLIILLLDAIDLVRAISSVIKQTLNIRMPRLTFLHFILRTLFTEHNARNWEIITHQTAHQLPY